MQGRDLVFEIGTEELPSSAAYSAIEQLQVTVPEALREARLQYGEIAVVATPRRIAILVTELAEKQADATHRHKGPSAKATFDESGAPTKAAEGFARGKGVAVESLEVVDEGGSAYVYATVHETGVDTSSVLPELLARIAGSIDFPKSQRWGSGDTRFSRPVRWLLALFGSVVVPVRFAGLEAGRITYGHRFLSPGPHEVSAAFEYPSVLDQAHVIVDQQARAQSLREGIESVAASVGGTAVVPDKTFAEVVNLVEWPTVTVGTFDEEFLAVPREMLEHAMGSHQRYFPVERKDGSLDNRFIVAHNGSPDRSAEIVRGHERVIRARLADAAFFYKEDLALTLEEWLPKLDSVVFQEKLGTTAAKVDRVERLAGMIAKLVGAPSDQTAFAERAAHLAKADLVTNAVIEFTDLQGVMGRYYALAAGEAPEVALAIEEHYRPRYAGDELPSSVAGRIVSIADKTDTIAGIFAAGMAPKGSADPFGLRRAAIGVLQMALDGTPVTLDELIGDALAALSQATDFDSEVVGTDIKTFFLGRFENILRDRDHAYDTINAVLPVAGDDPADALARCEALSGFRSARDDMEDLSVAYTRAKNLSKPELGDETDEALMGPEELALAQALTAAERTAIQLLEARAYSALLESYAGLRGPIDEFFDKVLVMDEVEGLRNNRLRLLNRFVALFGRFADFSQLAG